MKHPDKLVQKLAALAARHGYGLVSATISGRSVVGAGVPRYVYGGSYKIASHPVESVDAVIIDGKVMPSEFLASQSALVTINVPDGYEAVTKTVGEISITTVRPVEPLQADENLGIAKFVREAFGNMNDRG